MEENKGATEAESLLEDLGFDHLPIKVETFINEVSDENFPISMEFHAFSSDKFLGKAIGNEGSAAIVINSNIKDPRRLNFTSAHEAGHVCMHIMEGVSQNFSCGNSELGDYFKNPFERQANGFASGLLMPKRLITSLTDGDVNWQNIKQISDKCDASLEAVFRRLSWLERAPVAMVIHQNGLFRRFISAKQFEFFIQKLNLSADQLECSVDVASEKYPSDFELVDPIDWVEPANKGLILNELYCSTIMLKNGFSYSLLTYDDDCFEDSDE